MNIRKHLPARVRRGITKVALKTRKNSPHILFGVGVAGFVGTTVLASRATLKVGPVLDEFKAEVDENREDATPRDMTYIYAKNTYRVVKLYAPAVVVGGVSIACLAKSHIQLTQRNNALMAAYTAVHTAYENYRERVRAEVGEERELELYHAAGDMSVMLEDGSTVIVKGADPNQWSPYARFFDEASRHWEPDAELNRIWVQCQQNYLNDLLRTRGYVFLNEAYEALGIEWSSPGQAVGWLLNSDGDNYIDFGIFEARNASFVNGHEPNILLDFNVDGVIIDKI